MLCLCTGTLGHCTKSAESPDGGATLCQRAAASGVWEAQIHALITLASCEAELQAHIAITAQALQIAQQHDDPYLILMCTQEMAGSYENKGYYANSLPYRAQALQLAYEQQDAYQIGESHYLYGLVHAHLGLFERSDRTL